MKTLFAIIATLLIVAGLTAQNNATVTLGTVVSTNTIVGVRRRIIVDFPDGGAPVTTVFYVIRKVDSIGRVSDRDLDPVVIEWSVLTNRYPEVDVILPRMNTDMAARLANQSP